MTNKSISDQLAVSVIIPSFNGRDLLSKHLPDVETAMNSGDELVIVDDASTDDTAAWVTQRYSMLPTESGLKGIWKKGKQSGQVQLLLNAKNLRFGLSCNNGVELASHPLICLLNNDVSPHSSCLTTLRHWFTDKRVFAVGCLEYQNSNLVKHFGKNKLWFEKGLFMHSRDESMETGKTAWVSGGSGMFRKSYWEQLGGFDPSYAPAYWEDIDLSWRARTMGWQVLFDKDASVIHVHETTNKKAFGEQEIERMSWRSAIHFTKTHATFSQLLQYYAWQPFWYWQRYRRGLV